MSRSRNRSGRVGAFFGGSFVGFILCLALLAGLGCFVYFKVSPRWINKTFKTNIDLGSDEINKKTLSDLVSTVVGLSKNMDTYTINNLNEDFGIKIKDELFGIDIKDLKEVPFDDLSESIEKKFANISAEELRNVSGMNLEESMGNILNKENVYYFNSADDKLYKKYDGTTFSQPVTFEFELNEQKTTVTTKGNVVAIKANKEVRIPLWYLPLTVALTDFTSNMGNQMTLADLEKDFGVKLPSFIKLTEQEKKETTVNELEGVVKASYVKDVLNLNIKTYEYSSETFYYDDKNNNNIKDDGEEISYVLYSLSGKKINELSSTISQMKFSEIFSEDERGKGVLSLIVIDPADPTTDPTIAQMPQAITTAVSDATIEDLLSKGIISVDDSAGKLTTPFDHDGNPLTDEITLQSLTVTDFIEYALNSIVIP